MVLGVLVVLAMAMLGPTMASAEVRGGEVQEYAEELGVSPDVATERLALQRRGVEIVGELSGVLGGQYAGVWFDNATGEFVVPLLEANERPEVAAALDGEGLADDFRTAPAASTLAELQAGQDRVDRALAGVIEEGLVQTLVDPRTNSVVVREAAGADQAAQAQVARAAAEEQRVDVDVREQGEEDLSVNPVACIGEAMICGNPMRGGVRMWPSGLAGCCPEATCTAGFKATGKANGERYVLTAGHCADSTEHWMSFDDGSQGHYLGYVEQYNATSSDYAKIKASGTFWDKPSWPSRVAYWGTDQERSISSESYSYIGQWVCHAGGNSGASCGTVTAQDITVAQPEGPSYHQTEFQTICSKGGDSGGPVFAGNTALGIFIGNNIGVEGQNPPYCGEKGYYTELIEAADALNVSVATRATQTSVDSATAMNGNPGWATVKGQVHSPGGPVNNTDVYVKLYKWETSSWALKATVPTKVNNGHYEISNWNGVGPGQWLAVAEYPAQGGYGASSSNQTTEGWFTVKDGYRIVSKVSGRCLDVAGANREEGAGIQQWDCYNPATQQNQVFTLVPQGGYVLLIARHSNRCVDIANDSVADGSPAIQWTCKAPGSNSNQLFQVVPAGGEYFELRAKHSGKCLTVHGALPGNGVPMLQWTCGEAGKWAFQSVDSGPIPIDTFINVPPGEVLNGQPGYVNVNGYVKAGSYALAGKEVYVNYQKETSAGVWTTLSTGKAVLNAEGYYAYPNMGVGVGNWRVRTVLPAAYPFAESISPYKYFEIKSGYQFIFRHSGQCMSLHANLPNPGTPILQWPCGNPPNPNLGQVFTLVPRGNGYYYVEINSTDQCVSVHGALQAQGTGILQWPCGGGTNQEWQIVPIAGQEPWFAMIARHSGQCASVTGSYNGASLVQWGCTWAGTQQWRFQPVN